MSPNAPTQSPAVPEVLLALTKLHHTLDAQDRRREQHKLALAAQAALAVVRRARVTPKNTPVGHPV